MQRVCLKILILSFMVVSHSVLAAEGCPSATELQRKMHSYRVQWQSFPEGSDVCPQGYLQKLYKIFEKLESLSLQDTLSANNEILKSLENPAQFFANSYDSLEYYQSKKAYAAFNPLDGKMTLADIFFAEPEIVALTILIHEAAHGRKTDRGHSQCYSGQLMSTYGGCDMSLSQIDSESGAYGYQFWFSWAYSRNEKLSFEERKYLRTQALDLATHRFNLVFDVVAFSDLIVGLTGDGNVQIFDPLLKQWLPLPGWQSKQKVIAIDYDARTHGLNIYLQDGTLAQWNSLTQEALPKPDIPLTKDHFPLHHVQRVFDFSVGAPRTVVFSKDGRYWNETADLENEGKRVFVPLELPESVSSPREILSLIGPKNVYLTGESRLQLFEGGRELKSLNLVGWPQKVKGIYPSLNGVNLYAIDKETGLLLAGDLVQRSFGPVLELDKIVFRKDHLQSPKGAKGQKYQEGFAHRVLLDQSGGVSIARHHDVARKAPVPPVFDLPNSQKMMDVAVIRTAQFQDAWKVTFAEEGEEEFLRNCAVKGRHVLKDPWLHRPMGLTSEGDWVVKGHQSDFCQVVVSDVQSLKSGIAPILMNPFGFPESQLILNGDNGQGQVFQPYVTE